MNAADLVNLEKRCDRMVAMAHTGNAYAVATLRQALETTADPSARKLIERAVMEALDEC